MNNNLPMNSSPPLIQYNGLLSQDCAQEKNKQLAEQIKNLQIENTKFNTKIIILENQIKEANEAHYKGQNNTSSNFYLPSELKTIWENIAQENIGDCFIDYFNYPIVTYHLVNEMFYIISGMIKDKLASFVHSFLSIINFNKNSNDYQKSYDALFNIIKPFLQENVKIIFENDNDFNQIFLNNYYAFYNQEIYPMVCTYNEADTIDEDFEVMIKSRSFEKTIENIKKIILCIELNDQSLQFAIDDMTGRDIKFASHLLEREILNVNGKTRENQDKLILINPPQMKNGFAYQNLMPIILPCDINEELYSFINYKFSNTSPGFSLRSTSYNNIYNYYNERDGNPFNNNEDYCDSNKGTIDPSNCRIETDFNNQEKVKTHRYPKNKMRILNTMFNNDNKIIHGYTKSLPKNEIDKNMNSGQDFNMKENPSGNYEVTFADMLMKTNKKHKVYKIKRQGKNLQIQEMRENEGVINKWWITLQGNLQKEISNDPLNHNKFQEEGKQININSNTGAIVESNTKKKKFIRDSRGTSRGSTSNMHVYNMKNKSHLNYKTVIKKNNSIDKHIYEYKTNAVTKLNVDELLSFKNKGRGKVKEFHSTFTEGNLKENID